MKELPRSEVYEQEFAFMPWGILIEKILAIIQKEAPQQGSVLDLLCGPGYLLGEIAKRRPDLILEGVDISDEFIQYARGKYPKITFETADVLSWTASIKYDVVLCTAGIHHLPYERQVSFLETISTILNQDGFAIFADPYVDGFSNELERKQSAAKLGYEYMLATIKKSAPNEVVKATVDILYNDVMGFEYKTSIKKLEPVFRKLFSHVEIHKTWPDIQSEYGDYYIVCKNGKK